MFSNERKGVDPGGRGVGQGLGRVEGGYNINNNHTLIRIYYGENVFSIKGKTLHCNFYLHFPGG